MPSKTGTPPSQPQAVPLHSVAVTGAEAGLAAAASPEMIRRYQRRRDRLRVNLTKEPVSCAADRETCDFETSRGRRARALAVWEDTLKSHLPTESENFTVLPLRVLSFSK